MAYSEQEARKLIIEAGHRLQAEGLIARTWGNISARISDTQFVITPSGLGYDTMKAEDLVAVNIEDCSWEGERKPSSEKGIHADVYRLRPEACFVIHTHQDQASVFGITGEDLQTDEEEEALVLGSIVPCASYGLPSTAKLRQAVAARVEEMPEAKAVLMKNHGALCVGKDCAQAFLVSRELERLCKRKIQEKFREWERIAGEKPASAGFWQPGKSMRKGNRFCHMADGKKTVYDLRALPKGLSPAAALHASIYKNSDVRYIAPETAPSVMKFCSLEESLLPYLDDLAQIAGTSIRFSGPKGAAQALKGRNAVLLRDSGALCTGKTANDVEAVRMILRKGSEARLFAKAQNDLWKEAGSNKRCVPLDRADALLQRMIYKKKYSKKKESGENMHA